MACLVELSVAEDISKDQEQKNVRRWLERAEISQEAKTASDGGIGRAIGRPHFCIVAEPHSESSDYYCGLGPYDM